VALSDSSGDTVQTYEYSVYGQVAVEDPNHPNPYMFAGRRFDIEIGLYYNRARYYNPFTGRFLQADPIGYQAGMNLYRYCCNNPLILRDPSGRDPRSAGTDDTNENPKVELPPGYDFDVGDQTDNYECVGFIVVPMRLNPGYVLLDYKASKGAFAMPKNLDLWLDGSGYNTYLKITLRLTAIFTAPYVKLGVKYATKISRNRYRAYLVFLKKTSNFWCWLTGERYKGQPIFVEITGGDGYDNLIYDAFETEGQATDAANEAMYWAIGYYKEWNPNEDDEILKAE